MSRRVSDFVRGSQNKIHTNLLKLNPLIFNFLIKKIIIALRRNLKKQLNFLSYYFRTTQIIFPKHLCWQVSFLIPMYWCRIPLSRCMHLATCRPSILGEWGGVRQIQSKIQIGRGDEHLSWFIQLVVNTSPLHSLAPAFSYEACAADTMCAGT